MGVREARVEEMELIESNNVWLEVNTRQAITYGYNIVGNRWNNTDNMG